MMSTAPAHARAVDFYALKAWQRTLLRTMVTDQCWIFLGAQSGKGYGCASVGSRTTATHRLAYEVNVGPIPDDAVIDHTCHDPNVCVGGKCVHRLCVNPAHLMPVAAEQNTARQTPAAATHCINGHLYTDLTTGISSGRRYCKACRSERAAEAARNRPVNHARSVAIRTWATENGIPVSRRGRVSEAVIDAWRAAGHPGWPTP
jgi:hypothetical protein